MEAVYSAVITEEGAVCDMAPILEIKNITKNFFLHEQKREIKSCRNISFTMEKGGFIGIVGES